MTDADTTTTTMNTSIIITSIHPLLEKKEYVQCCIFTLIFPFILSQCILLLGCLRHHTLTIEHNILTHSIALFYVHTRSHDYSMM